MVDAYCMKCKTKKSMIAPNKKVSKNGRPYLQSKCQSCCTKINRFVSMKK